MMTRKRLVPPVVLLILALALPQEASVYAKDREFSPIANYLKKQYNARRKHKFLLSIAGLAVKFVRPAGVKSLKLQIFENLDVDAEKQNTHFSSTVQGALGKRWQPLVRVHSREGEAKQAYIYASEAGKNIKLMVVVLERRQAVVARVKLNPETLVKWLEKPEIMGISLDSRPPSNKPDAEQDINTEAKRNIKPDTQPDARPDAAADKATNETAP